MKVVQFKILSRVGKILGSTTKPDPGQTGHKNGQHPEKCFLTTSPQRAQKLILSSIYENIAGNFILDTIYSCLKKTRNVEETITLPNSRN